jgi:uncharacterized protein YxjI
VSTSPLSRNLFFVREHVGFFKAANNYDILDPNTGEELLECRELNLGWVTKIFRFTRYKQSTPFNVTVQTPDGVPLLHVRRGVSLFLSKVDVFDGNEQRIGGFKQKLFSFGGAFKVLGPNDEPLCELKGKWTGWEFRFLAGERQLARVTKKWNGIGRELFTTADNYILEIAEEVPPENRVRLLILAAVLCIDMVLKE